ncbi:N-acetyltransferase 9 [Mortierella sp. GBA43]|nr:N-acetyltransferase 9 [Mortierella sp. GBA43]
MAGDVNLFFNDHDDPHSAEIEIMIAGTKRITAKISSGNKGSIQLFTSQLGFTQIGFSEVFDEVTLEKQLSEDMFRECDPRSSEQLLDGQIRAQFETLELEANLDH